MVLHATVQTVLQPWFQEPLGLAAGASLLALLLLYLIRPTPPRKPYPSVMFLLESDVSEKQTGWWHRLLRNTLLLLQLSALLLFTVAAAQPVLPLNQSTAADHAVFVLDVSASMQIGDRFDTAAEAVETRVTEENTVIAAGETPRTIVEDQDANRAQQAVSRLQPQDVGTGLADAIQAAAQHADTGTTVYVASDFAVGNREALNRSRHVVESTGADLQYIPVGRAVENAGITGLAFTGREMRVTMENRDLPRTNFTLHIDGEAYPVAAARGETTTVAVPQPIGETLVELEPGDAFPADDTLHVMGRPPENVSTLLLTSNASRYITAALAVNPEVEYEVVEPPTTRSFETFDIVFTGRVDPDNVLPRTRRALQNREKGLVVKAAPGMFSLGLDQVNPVDVQGVVENGVVQRVPHPVTEDVRFGVNRFYNASLKQDAVQWAFGPGKVPVIAKKKNVVYYGILDELSTFRYRLRYPMFWKHVIQDVTGRDSLSALNKETGTLLEFDKQTRVETPGGETVEARVLSLDQAGFYRFNGKTVAANLVHRGETGAAAQQPVENVGSGETEEGVVVPVPVTRFVIAAVFLVLVVELLYVTYRGEL